MGNTCSHGDSDIFCSEGICPHSEKQLINIAPKSSNWTLRSWKQQCVRLHVDNTRRRPRGTFLEVWCNYKSRVDVLMMFLIVLLHSNNKEVLEPWTISSFFVIVINQPSVCCRSLLLQFYLSFNLGLKFMTGLRLVCIGKNNRQYFNEVKNSSTGIQAAYIIEKNYT